jgi:hypothetical protein
MPFTSIVLTMPDHFWTIFQHNRNLLNPVPQLGAQVIQDWVRHRYGAEVAIVVVPHTFGARLNFNLHLHVVASRQGLKLGGTSLVEGIDYSAEEIMTAWQRVIISYLSKAVGEGWVTSELSQDDLLKSIRREALRDWVKLIRNLSSVHQYLRYMGRYLRRQPIANNRLISSVGGEIEYNYWRNIKPRREKTLDSDKRTRFGTIKRLTREKCSVKEFFLRLADQISLSYDHGVRYFGLLAPRSKTKYSIFLRLLGKQVHIQVRHHRWAYWIYKRFGNNPLRDSAGKPMKWVRSIPPQPNASIP